MATLAQDIFSMAIDCGATTAADTMSVRNPASGLRLLKFTLPKPIDIAKVKVAA